MQRLSKAVAVMAEMARKEVCPRDEIADPPGTAVLHIDRHGLLKVSCCFVHYVVCNHRS